MNNDNGNAWATEAERDFLESKKPASRDAKSKKSHKEFIADVANVFSRKFPEGCKRALNQRGFRKQDMITYLSDGDSPVREERLSSSQIFEKVSTTYHKNENRLTFSCPDDLQLVQ